jgi:uncharacterized membrane protein
MEHATKKEAEWLEVASLLVLITLWVICIAGYKSLPQNIPSHYNALGEPDKFSDRSSIYILPAVATVVYMMLSILGRIPGVAGFKPHGLGSRPAANYMLQTLLRTLKLATLVVFGMIILLTFQTSLGRADGLGRWFLPVVLVILLLPIVLSFFKTASFEGKSRRK